MTISLNTFLRRLPELVVDNIIFIRGDIETEYYIHNGMWKLQKRGYNEYAARKLIESKWVMRNEWSSSESEGDIHIQHIKLSLSGVRIILGDDVNTNGDF